MVKKKHSYEAHGTNSTNPKSSLLLLRGTAYYRFKNKALTKAQLKQS